MSVILQNKTLLIHVACEVVTVGVLVFLITKKTNNLWLQVDVLTKKLEEQEEVIQNHERIIKQLVAFVNQKNPTTQPHKHVKNVNKRKENPLIEFSDEEEVDEEVEDDVEAKTYEAKVDNIITIADTESELDLNLVAELAELEDDNSSQKNE
jgi:hypothetical protein